MPSEYKTTSARASTLEEETRIVIEEARMVLPGIQTLFGFQLIAVFNQRFLNFSKTEQTFHLLALLLVAAAVALIMAPAAYHRISQRGTLSRRFIDLASRFLTCAMLPLMVGIAIDSFLVSRLIVGDIGLSGGIGLALLVAFLILWYVFPWTQASGRRSPWRGKQP
jgi:hypothetical protein